MTNSTNNANVARDNLFGNENQSAGYSKWVGVAGAAVAAGLAVSSGKSPVSALIGGVAGAAGGYLIGNMMDAGAPFMDTPTKLAVATLSGAVGFGLATQVCAQAEVMSGNADVSVNI
jgi:hypothetical protein